MMIRPSPWARIMARRALEGPATIRDEILLGADRLTGKRITVSRNQFNLHFVVTGRSGRGKTETVLTLCAGAAGLEIPIFYVDGKGDPAVQYALRKLATTHNKPFYAFDSVNPAASCAWHVCAGMNPTAQADMIVRQRRFSEPHYEAKAARFALVVCNVLRHVGIEVDLFNFKQALSVDRLLAHLRHNAGKEDDEGRALMTEVIALRTIEKDAVDSLASEVGRLTDAFFGALFDISRARRDGRSILRLAQARKERAIVYIGLPALEYSETAAKVGALAVAALKATLPALDREHRANSNEPLPLAAKQLFYVFDEWSVFAGDHVLNVVNMGRSYGGSACLAAQSYADFLIDGRDQLLRQVAGSTATFIVHECNDPQDAEYAAGLFGTQDSVEYTAQTVTGTPTGAASARRVKEFVVHPDAIKNVGVGEAFYMNKNDKDKDTNRSIVRLVKVRKSSF